MTRKCKPTLRMDTGGGWETRQALLNAQTSASSIVRDQAQRQGAAQVRDLQIPTGPGMDQAGYFARNPGAFGSASNPTDRRLAAGTQTTPMAPVVDTPAPAQSTLRNGMNTYTSAPAPLTPVQGGPITRVGNSFSNVRTPNADPMYSGLRMDPFNAGNQQAVSNIRSFGPAPAEQPGILGGASGTFHNVLGMSGPPARMSQRPGPSDENSLFSDATQASKYGRSTVGLRNGGDLRTGHGGEVPGSGSGDKIPAKYEPGEFVVSNDMLDDAPGLRDQLRDLREQTLAARGKTVAEADAAAVRYDDDTPPSGRRRSSASLRALGGFEGSEDPTRWAGNPNRMGGNLANESLLGAARQRIDPVQTAARESAWRAPPPAAAPAAAPWEPVNPNVAKGVASGEASAWANARAAGGNAATAGATTSRLGQGIRDVWGSASQGPGYFGPQPGPASGILGKIKGAGVGAAKALGPMIGVAVEGKQVYDVAKDPRSTGIDVATQTAEGAGKLATGIVGGKIGAALGAFGGAAAPVTVPLGGLIGGAAGYFGGEAAIHRLRSLVGSDSASPAERFAPKQPDTAPPKLTTAGDATMPGQDPGRNTAFINATPLTSKPDLREAYPQVPDGQRVMEMDNRMAAEMRAQRMAAESQPQMPIVRHSGNDWESRNNLRNMGVSASSTTLPKGERHLLQTAYQNAQVADQGLRSGTDPATLAGIKAKSDMASTNATLRGQQLAHDANMYGHDVSRMNNKASMAQAMLQMQRDQMNKDREFKLSGLKAQSELESADQTRGHNAYTNTRALFDRQHDITDKDGKRVRDEGAEQASFISAMKQTNGELINMPEADRNKLISEVITRDKMLRDANSKKDGSLLQAVGFDGPTPAFSNLPTPDQLSRASLKNAGFLDGITPWGNVKRHDWKLDYPDASGVQQSMHFDPDTMDSAAINMLKQRGLKLNNQ